MNNIYVNETTGKKIKVYKKWFVHVFDHDDPRDILDFRDTEENVAGWCYENVGDFDNSEDIHEAYENENWEDVIELTQCRYCDYEYEEEWVVEEIKEENNA